MIGKWLATHPDVIILDEPTKGIDIGSKAAVHQFMSELVAHGLAVIMVSSELPGSDGHDGQSHCDARRPDGGGIQGRRSHSGIIVMLPAAQVRRRHNVATTA